MSNLFEAVEGIFEEDKRFLSSDGTYYINKTRQGFGKITATMRVEEGKFIVENGSVCATASDESKKVCSKS